MERESGIRDVGMEKKIGGGNLHCFFFGPDFPLLFQLSFLSSLSKPEKGREESLQDVNMEVSAEIQDGT